MSSVSNSAASPAPAYDLAIVESWMRLASNPRIAESLEVAAARLAVAAANWRQREAAEPWPQSAESLAVAAADWREVWGDTTPPQLQRRLTGQGTIASLRRENEALKARVLELEEAEVQRMIAEINEAREAEWEEVARKLEEARRTGVETGVGEISFF